MAIGPAPVEQRRARGGARCQTPDRVSHDAPAPLLGGHLDPAGHTILYGPGGAGKGALATDWIRGLVEGGHTVLILDYENHPDEWSRRYAGVAGAERSDRVIWVAPLAAKWTRSRGAIWRQERAIAELVEAFEVTVIVVDSIVVACGGADPMDPGTPARYAATLEYLNRPVMSIAHTPKDNGLAYPFGSVFWHNLARVTWKPPPRRWAACAHPSRKANNYAALGRFLVSLTWWEGRLGEVSESPYAAALARRIEEVLGDDQLTVAEIVDRLADEDDVDDPIKPNSVNKALRRGVREQPPRFTVDGSGA